MSKHTQTHLVSKLRRSCAWRQI